MSHNEQNAILAALSTPEKNFELFEPILDFVINYGK